MTKKKDSADKAIRDIRRATCGQFSAEEIIQIVLEGLRGKPTQNSYIERFNRTYRDELLMGIRRTEGILRGATSTIEHPRVSLFSRFPTWVPSSSDNEIILRALFLAISRYASQPPFGGSPSRMAASDSML